MDHTIHTIGLQILEKFRSIPQDARLLVSVAGIPGSGKSTLAYPLAQRINSLLLHRPPTNSVCVDTDLVRAEAAGPPSREDVAVCVGLDGWHHTRSELNAFENPEEARRRRGAAFTFNARSYLEFIKTLRTIPGPSAIPFPTFDHALKDPLPSPTPILSHHRVIVVEGLYCLANQGDWNEASELFDVKIFVECDRAMARERVIKRNFEAGVEPTLEQTIVRVDTSDMVNGEWVLAHLVKPDVVVESLDDPALGGR